MAGQPELGVGGDHQPGPSIRRVGRAEAGCGPAEDLFEEPESVFQVETAEEGLPESVYLLGGGRGGGVSQPQRFRRPGAGQSLDLEPDHRAFHDRERTVVVGPGARAVRVGCNRSQERECASP
jgi:hypothetical protein